MPPNPLQMTHQGSEKEVPGWAASSRPASLPSPSQQPEAPARGYGPRRSAEKQRDAAAVAAGPRGHIYIIYLFVWSHGVFVAVCGFPIVVASLVAEHRL